MGNGMMYCKDMCQLLLRWSKRFFRCIRWIWWASGSICKPLMGHTVLFLTEIDSQNSHKMSDLGYPLSTSKWCDMLQGETSIAAEVYHIFPWIYYLEGGASDSIFEPLIVHTITMPFLYGLSNYIQTDCQIWGSLSTQESGRYTVRRSIHYYWSGS